MRLVLECMCVCIYHSIDHPDPLSRSAENIVVLCSASSVVTRIVGIISNVLLLVGVPLVLSYGVVVGIPNVIGRSFAAF